MSIRIFKCSNEQQLTSEENQKKVIRKKKFKLLETPCEKFRIKIVNSLLSIFSFLIFK